MDYNRSAILLGKCSFIAGASMFLVFTALTLIYGHVQDITGMIKELRVMMVSGCFMLVGIGINLMVYKE